jgi:hypothetical protein
LPPLCIGVNTRVPYLLSYFYDQDCPEGPFTIKSAIYECKNAYTTVSASAMEVPCSPVADPGFDSEYYRVLLSAVPHTKSPLNRGVWVHTTEPALAVTILMQVGTDGA